MAPKAVQRSAAGGAALCHAEGWAPPGQQANALPVGLLENRVFARRNVKIFTDGQDTVEQNAHWYGALQLDARIFNDRRADATLRSHDGAHPLIISRLLDHPELKGWVHRALACLRDWAEQSSAVHLRVIVYCRAGKHRSQIGRAHV